MSSSEQSAPPLSYRDSGVDIDAGSRLVERIRPIVRKTFLPGVLQEIGGFGAQFELPIERFRSPVLVSGTDGVGTKLILAKMLGRHDTIGIDLVAMCVNDIVVCGAEPLYFLDYLAAGKLDPDLTEQVIRGIARGCEIAGCALTGGEMAEMPGLYQPGDYDLAGFATGIVEKSDIINPERVRKGDMLIGLRSSGLHSNGYSLVRKIIARSGIDLDQPFDHSTLGSVLLHPTRIYVKSILNLIGQCRIGSICHITGGGLTENLPRALPDHLGARIFRSAWEMPAIFEWLQDKGNVETREMLRTFNCGIGMTLCIAPEDTEQALQSLKSTGEMPVVIGEVFVPRGNRVVFMDQAPGTT